MPIDVPTPDRIAMSQRERDVLKVLHTVLRGERTQAEAARLLGLSTRQVRRIQRKLEATGDQAVVHGLRGRPSNHRPDPSFKRSVLDAYRARYADFGPTFASEKLAEEGLHVCPQTLRRWLLAEGLWQRRRRRDPHRSRRPRRSCFGELVQIDASIHDWLEGRGDELVLISMIDDATSYTLARFYPAGTVEAHLDLLERWLRRHGRPLALYSDRHSIFEPQDKGRALPDAETQFGRALRELGIELIRAHSPQAKGRVERSFGTAQDRWVKELRLAGVTTREQANEVLGRLLPAHNRRFSKKARQQADAHRPLGPGHDLKAILSIQEERVVANDYTIRFRNRFYQLLPPVWPGERGGKVVIELRLDGSLAIRFRGKYLKYQEVAVSASPGGPAPRPPEFSASAADASAGEESPAPGEGAGPTGVQPAGGRSGRTPAEPYPPDGAGEDSKPRRKRPAEDHPWRKPFKRPK
jgi:DNA-binding CsgD family transcriptional regulator